MLHACELRGADFHGEASIRIGVGGAIGGIESVTWIRWCSNLAVREAETLSGRDVTSCEAVALAACATCGALFGPRTELLVANKSADKHMEKMRCRRMRPPS